MNGNDSVLAVYLGNQHIAHLLLADDQLKWQYTAQWQTNGYAISPNLPLSNDIPLLNVNRFLRNLLPEGYALDELLQNIHVSRNNTFALVRALGLDTPGALVFKPPDSEQEETYTFRKLTEEELAARLDQRDIGGLIIWDGKPRLSVAGLQDKINLVLEPDGQLGFGEGALCSTHILKFERQTQSHLILNEYLTMRLAANCGLKVAKVALKQMGRHPALLVERFDRKRVSHSHVKRRHIIDGCQALNLPPEYKYEKNFGSGRDVAHIRDGVSLPRLFKFSQRCQNPALTKQQMLDWLLFNLLVFNFDAHGKNISFFIGTDGISLTPFYDLLNIKMYPEVDQDFAMAIGDEFASDQINAYQLADFAESCQLSRSYVASRLKLMINKMLTALPQEITYIQQEFDHSTFFSDYQSFIVKRCEHFQAQYADIRRLKL